VTELVRTRAELAAARAGVAGSLALVPTMGALHDGHAELIRLAGTLADVVAVSIFVNPLQFGPAEDLDRYPRTPERDVELLDRLGVRLVFAPGVAEMYPDGRPAVTVDPGPLGALLEGASRPGHFAGVLTVVAKLFHVVAPDVAFFGEKDYQQLVLITKMVADLNFPLAVVGVPTVREPDGLALSSRNAYLSSEQRPLAATLQRALAAGAAVSARGPEAVLATARAVLDAEPSIDVDYLELRDPELGGDPQVGRARLLVAARLGTTRLIDNIAVFL